MRNVVRLLGLNSKNVISINVGRDNFINLLLLSFVYAVYFLLLTIAMYLPGGVLESEETIIFVQGWVTVPILSLLTMVIVHRYKNVGNENDGFFYPVFLFSNYTLCFMFTVGLMLGWWLFSSPIQLPRLVNAILVFFPLLQLALLWALKKYRLFWISIVREKTIQSLYGILPHIIVVFIASFSSRLEIIAVSLATICLAILFNLLPKHFFVSSKKLIRWMPLLLDTMAILLIIGACFDPKIAVSIYNQNFYLGPVNALLHGRIILVNVFSQYGVLALEFVALVFKMGLVPLSYQGFSFLVALLSMFQYAVIYILLRSILKSPWLSFFALSVILLINFFATADFFQAYPSIGPLRFGLSYLMALLFMLYYKYPSINPVFVFFAYVVLGVASLWSFEAFIYVAFMFLGMVIYQSIIMNGQDLSKIVRSVLYGLLFAVLSIGICQAIMAGVVFAQTSEWPKWGYYFAYIFLYQGGFGSMPVDPWSPWFLMIAAYFLCLSSYVIKWLVERKLDSGAEQAVVFCLCLFGIAQFTYYLNRSHPNNLFHISVPAIMIAFYGIEQLGKLTSNKYSLFRYFATINLIIAMLVLGVLYLPRFLIKFPNTGFGFARALVEDQLVGKRSIEKSLVDEYNLLWARQPSSLENADAVYLIRKYAGGQTSVTVFLSNDSTTEVLLLSDKIHAFLIDHPSENVLNARVRQLIYDYKPMLHTGDIVFLASDPGELLLQDEFLQGLVGPAQFTQYRGFQQQLVLGLCEEFSFEKLEATSHGVTAFRLLPLGYGSSDYCARLKALK